MELTIKDTSHFAIYNSLPFHYEMYGFILNYAKNINAFVDIYSVKNNEIGWLEFYANNFNNFCIKPIEDYNPDNNYDYIFLTTDTDRDFTPQWFNEKVIIINHDYKIRNPYSLNYINVANFKGSSLDYCIPCYPISNHYDKLNNNVISIIGGHEIIIYNTKYNIDSINRIKFNNPNPIELHFISRNIDKQKLNGLDKRFIVYIHENISTIEMDIILKKTNYIWISFCDSENKREAHLASGSIQLAYNYLCCPIINRYTNKYLKLKGALEYDEQSTDIIMLDDVNFTQLEEVRNNYINYLPIAIEKLKKNFAIPKKIMQTWETKTFSKEFQQIIDSWKIYNPNYEYILFDNHDREEFIKEHFDYQILQTYKSIIPGAYKSDLFRYCYLYVRGGVYADIDTLCLGNLDKLMLSNINLITAIDLNINVVDGNHNLVNGFICARPKHKVFLNCISIIVDNVRNNTIPVSKINFSGPGVLGQSVNLYLGKNATDSFVGEEGIIRDILLLKFEPNTEYIKDIYDNIYLQNKNGNNMIIHLYNLECQKIKDYVCWVTSNKIIKENTSIQNIKNRHIALMMCGQFRTYKYNLRQNLLALRPILQYNSVYVFILTDKLESGNYSETNEIEVLDIFKEFGFKIGFIKYIEDCDMTDEKLYCASFLQTIKHNTGISNSFVPNLMYRKYLLNKFVNEFINQYCINIDLFFYARIFDTIVLYNNNDIIKNNFNKIENTIASLLDNPQNVIFSSDTLFIGQNHALTNIFNIWNEDGTIKLFHDDIWNDNIFSREAYQYDSVLVSFKHTYSPEIQYMARIYKSNYKLNCIRIDHNNPVNISNNMLYNIIHDPDRFQNKVYPINLNLSNVYISKINENINDGIVFNYETIYFRILTLISHEVYNCLVINIGQQDAIELVALLRFHSSNIRKTVVYSFDLNHNLNTHVEAFLKDRPLKIFNENIYDGEILSKYKSCFISSKIIIINIYNYNHLYINNILQYLYDLHYEGLVLVKNNLLDINIIGENYLKHRVTVCDIEDQSIYFIKFF